MALSSVSLSIGMCDPLIWHLVEARDIAIATGLTETANTIEQAICTATREFRAAIPVPRPRYLEAGK